MKGQSTSGRTWVRTKGLRCFKPTLYRELSYPTRPRADGELYAHLVSGEYHAHRTLVCLVGKIRTSDFRFPTPALWTKLSYHQAIYARGSTVSVNS